MRDLLLSRLAELRSNSNPFFPQEFSADAVHRSTSQRGEDYKRYGELFVTVRDADADSSVIADIADEVMPDWRNSRTE